MPTALMSFCKGKNKQVISTSAYLRILRQHIKDCSAVTVAIAVVVAVAVGIEAIIAVNYHK